jgi:hypothetical protein
MNASSHLMLSAALLLPGAPALRTPQTRPLAAQERQALTLLDDARLARQSAGRSPMPRGLDDATRAELRRLQSEHRSLAEQRAGDLNLTDDQLVTVLLVVGIIVLIAILV